MSRLLAHHQGGGPSVAAVAAVVASLLRGGHRVAAPGPVDRPSYADPNGATSKVVHVRLESADPAVMDVAFGRGRMEDLSDMGGADPVAAALAVLTAPHATREDIRDQTMLCRAAAGATGPLEVGMHHHHGPTPWSPLRVGRSRSHLGEGAELDPPPEFAAAMDRIVSIDARPSPSGRAGTIVITPYVSLFARGNVPDAMTTMRLLAVARRRAALHVEDEIGERAA